VAEERSPDSLQDFILQNHPAAGAADIYCMGPPSLDRLAEAVSVLLGISDGREHLIDQVTVVRPPPEAGDAVESEVIEAIAMRIGVESGEGDTPALRSWLARRLQVQHAENLGLDALIAALPPSAPKLAVVVTGAVRYRAPDAKLEGQPGVGQPENFWTPHLTRLAARCVATAKERLYYVLIDAGEYAPFRPHNLALIQSIDNCGVITCAPVGSPDQAIADRAVAWLESIRSGRVGDVIAEIDQLALSDHNKGRLKVQLLSQAGLHAEAMRLLMRELDGPTELGEEAAIAYALVARRAHDDDLVDRLIGVATPHLIVEEHLETALRLAHETGNQHVEALAAARLAERYPQANGLLEYRLMLSRAEGDYEQAATLLTTHDASRDHEAQFYHWLAANLAADLVDYDAVLQGLDAQWADFADVGRIALARHAESTGDLDLGLAVLLSPDLGAPREASEVKFLLHLAELSLLRHGPDAEDFEEALVAVATVAAVYLAGTPNDPVMRTRLGRLLSVESSGSMGRMAGMLALLRLVDEEPELVPEPARQGPALSVEGVRSIMSIALNWIQSEPLVSIGRMTFPPDRLPSDFDPDIGPRLLVVLDTIGDTLTTEADVRALLINTAIVAALAPHTRNPDLDLSAMKLAATKLIFAGCRQQARDLIEGVLEMAEARPERRRAAWFAYGDVYHRTGDYMEALLAMVCGLACRTPISAAQAWFEDLELMRLLRDMGAAPFARDMIDRARRRLAFMGQAERYEHRLRTMSLTVDFHEFSAFGRDEPGQLEAMVQAMAGNCRAVLAEEDEVAPIATLLAQAVRLARAQAVPLPEDIDHLIEDAVSQLGEPLATTVRTYAARSPDAVDLVRLSTSLETARYSSDAGFDVANLALLARRFLATGEALDFPSAVFALEVLADQAAVRRDPSGEPIPPVLPATLGSPLAAAVEIAGDGLGVVMLGLDENSRLVRAHVEARGEHTGVEREPEHVFSNQAFRAWSRTYPYAYGFEEDEGNAFLNSMRGIGLSALPEERTVLVMDTALQTLPPNLIKVADEFAARDRPVALAPSLTWLAAARERRGRSAGPPQAWISTAAPGEVRATLAAMAERLEPALRQHSIALNTQAEIPTDFAGAEMAIVGAHGGIHLADGRYFRAVADEAELVAPARALARALANVKVVVLLVCSGGRLDAAPGAHTTVGLAKQLLDQGCSTVIGSPWPLAWNVPVFWLPEFLEAWRLGEPVIDANFLANEAVRRNLRDTTDVGLAMSVYGDPLVKTLGH
jgi:hypothetical protein